MRVGLLQGCHQPWNVKGSWSSSRTAAMGPSSGASERKMASELAWRACSKTGTSSHPDSGFFHALFGAGANTGSLR
ncbi:hypothetical protein WA016_01060 [Myxococcus stipitatus]